MLTDEQISEVVARCHGGDTSYQPYKLLLKTSREFYRLGWEARGKRDDVLHEVGESAKGWLAKYEDEVRDPSEEEPCKRLVRAVDALIERDGNGDRHA